jgi:uncharacterized phage protein gp47/JayE
LAFLEKDKNKKEATIVDGGINGGCDPETDEEFRTRILARLKNPIRGGTRHDYIQWAKELPFVDHIWGWGLARASAESSGKMLVSFAFSVNNFDNPVPSETNRAELEQHLNQYAVLGTKIWVRIPQTTPVNFEISTKAISYRPIVELELRSLLHHINKTQMGVLYRSRILQTIAQAMKGNDFSLTAPSTDFNLNASGLFIFGGIKWTTPA